MYGKNISSDNDYTLKRGELKMRSKRYGFILIIVMLSCSLVLASCEAITAQAITQSDASARGNGGLDMNRGPGSRR